MARILLITSILGGALVSNAFTIPLSTFCSNQLTQRPPTVLSMGKTKNGNKKSSRGFGKEQKGTDKMFKSDNDSTDEVNTVTSTIDSPASTTTTATTNAGADALSRLRRQKAEQRDEELRAIREMKSVDQYIASEPDAAVIPEQVAQRMGRRMLPFVGIPLFGVMGTFVVFWYLATYKNLEFQPALVAFSTIGVLGVSLLVSYQKC